MNISTFLFHGEIILFNLHPFSLFRLDPFDILKLHSFVFQVDNWGRNISLLLLGFIVILTLIID